MRIARWPLLALGVFLLLCRVGHGQIGYSHDVGGGYVNGEYVESDYVLPSDALLQPHPLVSCYPRRPPSWIGTFDFDFLILRRSRVKSLDLVTVDGVDALDARELNFDETFGFRATATIPANCGCDVQMSYLTSHDFSDSARFTGTNVQDFFFGVSGSQTELDVSYKSNLDSLEFNVRSRQWASVAPLAGLRVVHIDEMTDQRDVPNDLTFRGQADNEMYGFQLGADALLAQWGPTRIESTVKGGVYYNDINVNGETASNNLNRSFSHVAFVGEVTIAGVWQIGPRHALRLGYQAMLVDGMALIFDQYDDFDITTGSGSLDLGRARYLGGFVSFEATW